MLNIISQAPLNHRCLIALYSGQMTIGARLRQLRIRNKLSGEKFGELCGVTKGMVSQWESDLITPPTDRLIELRKHLKFSFDELLQPADLVTYSTSDPKLVSILHALEPRPEYVKDAAVKAILSNCELDDRAKSNGTKS